MGSQPYGSFKQPQPLHDSASLKYKIFDWMDVVGRLRWDDAGTKQEDKRYASTTNLFAHSKYGFYGYDKVNDRSLYGA